MESNAVNSNCPTKPALFGIGHAVVLGVLWLGFTVLTYVAVSGGLSNASQERGLVIMTTLGTISGPMTGAISQRFQSCCLQASLTLLPYAAVGLLLGSLFQGLPSRIAPAGSCCGWEHGDWAGSCGSAAASSRWATHCRDCRWQSIAKRIGR